MYILAIYTGHNATAALLKDGAIIACVSEERFNNIKNYIGFPKQAIAWCLDFAGISGQELTKVVRCGLYGAPIHHANQASRSMSLLSLLYNLVGLIRKTWRRLVYYLPFLRQIGALSYRLATKTIGRYTVAQERRFIAKGLGIDIDKVVTYEHHFLHAATAYYSSPYNQQKALVLTLDAEGDHLSATVNIFDGVKVQRIAQTGREHSLGWIYLYLTQYLGMKPMEHEYKVMGLAPYAKPAHVKTVYDKIKDSIILDPKNRLRFQAKHNTTDWLYYLRQTMPGYRFDNIAGAWQKLFEDRLVEWVSEAIKQTKISTVCFAGGGFMNVKANQKIGQIPGLKQYFFMPSAGDESLPIGGCYVAYIDALKAQKPRKKATLLPIDNLYWGPAYTNEEIITFLNKGRYAKKYLIRQSRTIEADIAELLAKGKVVARVRGRMEWGARALGNRSIMANPSDPDVVMIINEQMKDRDFWMPFAPSILADRLTDYVKPEKINLSSFMIISFDSTELGRQELKAAIHPYDFTLRPQTVIAELNESYYKIIKEFEKLTGIGGILNTSFNLHGYPIVKGPAEAMHAFEHSGLEYLALEDYLISKP